MKTIIVKHLPSHMRLSNGDKLNFVPELGQFKDSDYDYSLELPHFLNYNYHKAKLIASPDVVIEVGDTLQSEYGFYAVVSHVVERRPAKGDYSKNKFCSNPDFVSVEF